jgi:hypothetical protein
MCKLVMKFDSSVDFSRACEHFENDSRYHAEVNNYNMSLTFDCKNGAGAETRKKDIEAEIIGLSFEYWSFEID